MFTGIVQAVGTIEAVAPLEGGVRVTVAADGLALSDVALGDSVCVQGACLTVVAIAGQRLQIRGFRFRRPVLHQQCVAEVVVGVGVVRS